jgi:hypothetical protein
MAQPDPFDPETLCAAALPPVTPPTAKSSRPRNGEPFLKGPIPWAWIQSAASLPGRALAVGLTVWFEAGCKKKNTVSITLARLQRMGMSADTARRGLRALAAAGLVMIESKPGRGSLVTLTRSTLRAQT